MLVLVLVTTVCVGRGVERLWVRARGGEKQFEAEAGFQIEKTSRPHLGKAS